MQTATSRVLRYARDLISDEGRHCRNALARDRDGRGVYYSDPDAVRFCARGAVLRAELDLRVWYVSLKADALLHAAAVALFPESSRKSFTPSVGWFDNLGSHVKVNNELPHACTMAVFDAAIAAEECDA